MRVWALRSLLLVAAASCGRVGFTGEPDPGGVEDAAATAADGARPTDGLVAWYRFTDDPSDGLITDASGNGHDAACAPGACPTLVAGPDGPAGEFSGLMHAEVPDDGAFQLTLGFTIAMWISPAQIASTATALSKPRTSGNGASFEAVLFDNVPPQILFFSTDGTTETWVDGGQRIPVDAWTHVAFRWAPGQARRISVDGVVVASDPSPVAIDWDATSLHIGADREDGALRNPFVGALDEVRIYNRDLDDAEVAALRE